MGGGGVLPINGKVTPANHVRSFSANHAGISPLMCSSVRQWHLVMEERRRGKGVGGTIHLKEEEGSTACHACCLPSCLPASQPMF